MLCYVHRNSDSALWQNVFCRIKNTNQLGHFPFKEHIETLFYKFIYGKLVFFGLNITARVQHKFQSQSTSHKIFSYTIKIQIDFIDTTTNTSHEVTNNIVKQSFIYHTENFTVQLA